MSETSNIKHQQSNIPHQTSNIRLLAWWQLLRIGNVFTAISNIIAGFLLVQKEWQPLGPLFLLMGSSALLYAAGMVLNDALDAELDAKERPERPIPSGRISRAAAFRVGFVLLITGIALACIATWQLQSRDSAVVAVLLALAIIAYDAKLKQTEFGPSAMGICRYLNVLLGASVAGNLLMEPTAWLYAAVVGMYTIGLTLFARSENATTISNEQSLSRMFLIGSFTLLVMMPLVLPEQFESIGIPMYWYFTMLVLLIPIFLSESRTFRSPGPNTFRSYVSMLLLGFVFLDALACYAVAGWQSGLIVLTLVIPPRVISRWAPMT